MPPIHRPTIRTNRLVLRPLLKADREAFVRFQDENEEFFRPWSPAPQPGGTGSSYFTEQFGRSEDGLNAGTSLRLAALTTASELVGFYNVNDIVRGVSQRGSASWQVGEKFAGAGYSKEAMEALIGIAFAPEGLALHRVKAAVIPDNVPSLRLAARLRFRQEGYAIRYLKIAGEWRDHILLARLVDE